MLIYKAGTMICCLGRIGLHYPTPAIDAIAIFNHTSAALATPLL
ncbi:hypothetical protein [Nostoc sp. 'Lobaria pulmonaria (5183) cyanobiont']|nr:hypothetical protein [Nostoc sp. 'Lobaria pulmonaria (5183) cyanobiont']